MATLELRRSSKWWYGRWTENGKVVVQNLNVEVVGRRPSPQDGSVDRHFEKSRAEAQVELDKLARAALTRKRVEDLAQVVHVARTGHRIGTIALTGLHDAWITLPRRHGQLSGTYITIAKGVFRRFAEFMSIRYPEAQEMADVTHEMAVAFLASERARGLSGRSFNALLSLLKNTFRHLRRQAGIVDNPFDEIVSQVEDTVHRIPFTPEELQCLLKVAMDDDFCRPLFVTGMCTAMRRGDVCQLRWSDVDMKTGFITVTTSKTGAKVSIPMFELLRNELAKRAQTGEYCFPEQAALYQKSPDGVARKLESVFAAAGFVDQDGEEDEALDEEGGKKKSAVEVLSEDEMLQRGRARLLGCTRYTNKVRGNFLKLFERYMAGGTSGDLQKEFKMSKAGVSTYFKRIESVVGFPVVRQRRPKTAVKVLGALHATRKVGLKKVNQRGFHAFRATWVTLALSAGVPVDLVRKVTGHTTVETVLTHYFQPNREDFRRTIEGAMPRLFLESSQDGLPAPGKAVAAVAGTGGQQEPARAGDALEEALKALEAMNAKNWRKQRDVAAGLIRKTQ